MPLTASLRDEENERISNILKRLIGLDYVPENVVTLDEILFKLDLDKQTLLMMRAENLLLHLQKSHFDFANTEQFGDFLVKLSNQSTAEQLGLLTKAIAVYNYIQQESKTFSVVIANKISVAKI